ncbi:MAG: putative ribosomal small subunit methyltransferase [Actinomycetota bacterium]|jgi:16S rRNA (guanine527-N7)-methyltransferase
MSRPSDQQLNSLIDALGEAQRIGMLGPGSLADAIIRAWAFVDACPPDTRSFVDLGCGGGIPGLVVAVGRPDLHGVLVDRRAKRIDLVMRLIGRLGLRGRIEAWAGDVADLPRSQRSQWDVATSRGFGSPAYTAHYAAAVVRPGGLLLVSEPPDSTGERWLSDDVTQEGFDLEGVQDGVARLRHRTPPA